MRETGRHREGQRQTLTEREISSWIVRSRQPYRVTSGREKERGGERERERGRETERGERERERERWERENTSFLLDKEHKEKVFGDV